VLIAGGETYRYDKAILDLGSIYTIPPLPGLNGENEFSLNTSLETARAFEEAISRCSSAAIVGTGQIALDVAEVLKVRNYDKIYLLGRSDCVLRAYLDNDMAETVEGAIREQGIELYRLESTA
jgi:NAD(P)H-nitrite reductase large subunit